MGRKKMKRYLVAIMCLVANCSVHFMRLNINTAIVKMVENITESNKKVNHSETSNSNFDNMQNLKIPTYNWNEKTQQMVLGAIYYGYVAFGLPGGWFASIIGGKLSMIFILLWASTLSFLIPWAAGVSVVLVIILRVLDGMGQGMLMSANSVLLDKWATPQERSTLLSIAFSGMSISAIFVSFISSLFCSSPTVGWPMSFYFYSVLGTVIAVAWMFLIYETPSEDPYISFAEIEHFKSVGMYDRHHTKDTASIPLWSIITSSPVWAVVIAYSTYTFTLIYILTEAPIFATKMLGYDLKTAGLLMLIPGIVELIVILLSGICADAIISRQYLDVLNTRKLFVIMNLGIPAVCLMFVGHVNGLASMLLLAVACGVLGLYASSLAPNAMEISTIYSGIVFGIMTTLAHVGGFLGPLAIGSLAGDDSTMDDWSLMFKLIAGLDLIGLIIYLIFADTEEQDWAKMENISKTEIKTYKSITE